MRPFPRYTYPAKNRHSAKLIVLPPSPKNGAPRQLSPINPSIPRIHLKPLPAQHRVLNSVPKHVANNYRDVVPRNPASCLCFSATEPNFHLKREKERKKKKKERKRRKKQKPPLLVGVSGFVSQPCATLLLPVVRARSNERGQREREIERKREREGAAGAPSSLGWRAAGGGQSRRGPRSLGPPAGAGRVGPKKGPRRDGGDHGDRLAAAHLHSLAEWADSQGRTYRLRPSSPSAIGLGTQIGPVHSPCPYLPPRAATEKVMRPIPPDYITFFAIPLLSFLFFFFFFRSHSFLPIRSLVVRRNEGRSETNQVSAFAAVIE